VTAAICNSLHSLSLYREEAIEQTRLRERERERRDEKLGVIWANKSDN